MKKNLAPIFFVAIMFLYGCASAPKFYEGIDGKFEVMDRNEYCSKANGVRDNGVQCLFVSANNKNKDMAFGLAQKYAVAAVLLRGVSGTHSSTQNPLIPSIKQAEKSKWIQAFFDNGEHLKYLDQAQIIPEEVFKIKGGYRVGIEARVNYQRLNRMLLDEGIIKAITF